MKKQRIDMVLITLVSFALLFDLLTMPLANKLSHIWMLEFTPSTIIFAFTFVVYDIISEIYGRKNAVFILILVQIVDVAFSLIIILCISLPSPSGWEYQHYYNFVFGQSLRFSLLGDLGVLLGQFINIYLITYWKALARGRFFWLRSLGSSSVGDIFTSISGPLAALLGVYSFHDIFEIMTTSYIIKLAIVIVACYPASVIVYFIKKKKGELNNCDIIVNPFKREEQNSE